MIPSPISNLPVRTNTHVNLQGLSLFSNYFQSVDLGYILNVSSILGEVLQPKSSMHMYMATKHAISAITMGEYSTAHRIGLALVTPR